MSGAKLAIKNDKPQVVKSIKNTLFLTYDLELLKAMWKLSPINDEIFEILPTLFKDMNNSNMTFNETGEVDTSTRFFIRKIELQDDYNLLSKSEIKAVTRKYLNRKLSSKDINKLKNKKKILRLQDTEQDI